MNSIAYMKKLDAYAKQFSAALDRSRMSSAALAQAVGVDPSYVSQWKTGRRPIPADKAVVTASLIGVNPALISEAYEKVASAGAIEQHGSSDLPSKISQSNATRLDPEMIAESYAALSEIYLEERGVPFDLTQEPERFVLVYEDRSRMTKNPSASEERRFGARVAEIVRLTGADLHGSRDGMPAEGDDKGPMARGVQRKKG